MSETNHGDARDQVRSLIVPFELRDAGDGDGLTLEGYAAVFNSPTVIDSWEGRFEETIAPGAFNRTIKARFPVLQFDHGKHPLIGSIPLGVIKELREDTHGLFVRARLSDNWLIQPVRDAIRDQAINGMSFRFSVPKDKDSWDNTGDMPKRTLHEVKLYELGPVVFPAYEDTQVGVRSEADNRLPQLLEERLQDHFGTPLEPATDGTSNGDSLPAEDTAPATPRRTRHDIRRALMRAKDLGLPAPQSKPEEAT